jgi:hypothetical protein
MFVKIKNYHRILKILFFCLSTDHLHTEANKHRDSSFAMLTTFIDYKHNKCGREVAATARRYISRNVNTASTQKAERVM